MTAPAPAQPVAAPPIAWILKLGTEQLSKRAGNETLTLTHALFMGDHWADGQGWSGPMPLPANADSPEQVTQVRSEVERTFVSRNLLRDIVERHRNGIAGREPLWTITPRRALSDKEQPTAQETAQITEFTSALTSWWDETSVWLNIHRALDTALWSERGHLRLFVRADQLDDLGTDAQGRPIRGVRAGTSLADVLKRIAVQTPEYAQTTVTRTTDGQITGSVHTWVDDQGTTHHEVQERERGRIRIYPNLKDGTQADAENFAYPIPDLLVYEIQLPALVTDSIRRLSKWLNKTLTMGSRNIDLGGFTETTILNAQMPEGRYVPDPENPAKKIFKKARPHLKGPGVTNYVNGLPLMRVGEDGKAVVGDMTTPSVVYKDPTPFQVFKDSLMAAREMIYDEARQLHVLITGDAAANGVSRQQAVNDFVTSLEPTRIALEALLRWLLGTVLSLGLHLADRTGEADAYRIRTQARVSAVQPTAQEIETALKLHEAGSISEETYLQRIGVEDVEAERDTRAREGITPALALRIAAAAPAPWIATRALQLGFPALNIRDEDVAAQRDLDLAAPTGPADLDPDPDPDPDADPDA